MYWKKQLTYSSDPLIHEQWTTDTITAHKVSLTTCINAQNKATLTTFFSFISNGNCITTESKQLLYHSFVPFTSTHTAPKMNERSKKIFFFLMFCFVLFSPHRDTFKWKVFCLLIFLWWQEHHHLYIAGMSLCVTENFIISLLPCFLFSFLSTYQISNICEKGCSADTQSENADGT